MSRRTVRSVTCSSAASSRLVQDGRLASVDKSRSSRAEGLMTHAPSDRIRTGSDLVAAYCGNRLVRTRTRDCHDGCWLP